ncbi:DUF748 domain-containing protein [Pseudomonas sp. M30-35]|uniref:DUF748 domain-containing protein n=1 Tax=Pseudomonas sp. M30-35 TaxID=1981174 RepID=UPI000B3C8632|nr:DUF748 domain-containing protein [Pseudomonas sp. M30-35]ARU87382.1 membrane biogenesis protein [Pseudomonas sp. M30-35]
MYKGLKYTAGTLIFGIGLYALLGFLIIPGAGLRVINQQLAQYATQPAKLERMQFNPFSLELKLWGMSVGAGETKHIAFERLYANVETDSAWTKALHLADIELDKAHSEILFDKDGGLNLTQLFKLPESPQPATEEPPGEPFPVRIDRIKLVDGYVHFQDLRPSEPINFVYDALNLELNNLSTLPDDNAAMTLSATGPRGGRIDWTGKVSLVPITSTGSIKVTDAQMKGFWPYVRDAVPLDLEKGVLNLSSDYTLDLAKSTELRLNNLELKVSPFAIKAPDGRPLVNLENLEVSDTTLDLVKQEVVVGKIRSQKLETWASREADGELDWQKLFASQPTAKKAPKKPAAMPTSPAANAPNAEPAANKADEPQAVAQADTETAATEETAANSSTTETTSTAATTDQDAKDQQVAANKAPESKPATQAAATPEASKPWVVLLKDVQLRDYQVHLADKVPEKDLALELGPLNLDIKNFNSQGTTPFDIKLDTGLGKQGKLQAEGKVQLTPTTANLNVTTQNIDLRVAQAYMDPFVRLELRSGMLGSQLNVALTSTAPLQLSVTGNAQVSQLHTLDTLKQRDFVRWKTLDLSGLSYKHGDSLSIDKVNLDNPYARFLINEDLTTNVSELVIPQPAEPNAKAEPAGKPLGIHIGQINIADGSANFADFSLTPNFATAIQQLNGQIGTIDSRAPKPAKINIAGKVDKYAPVSIKGSLNPFDPLASLDIATQFKRVELTTLTPYSGKFAGYRIRKGRLNLDLHYRINNGKLNAENSVVVEQLQLGEKVDSPSAVDLPIKLAVALLKDSDGKISLALPVQGDLNNPQFSVMPIVWQTLRNLVVRAATAPFKFIGGLVSGGSDVDLSNVQFAAGSSELDKTAQTSLDTLIKALAERPALRLEVEGMSAQASDGPLLAEQRLQREYQSTYYKMLQRRGDTVPGEADELEVPDDVKGPMLEGIYRARLKKQPPAEWAELDKEQRSKKLSDAVVAHWSSSELLLRKLAQERAATIKDYLAQNGLSDERIYLLDVSLGTAATDGRVASPLQLGSE